jgi:hypothetical protein
VVNETVMAFVSETQEAMLDHGVMIEAKVIGQSAVSRGQPHVSIKCHGFPYPENISIDILFTLEDVTIVLFELYLARHDYKSE